MSAHDPGARLIKMAAAAPRGRRLALAAADALLRGSAAAAPPGFSRFAAVSSVNACTHRRAQPLNLRHVYSAPPAWAPPPPPPPTDDRRPAAPAGAAAGAAAAAGWTRAGVLNGPNAISLARLLSGPLIAHWIVAGDFHLAAPALAVSAASDWADGALARRLQLKDNVLGTYLDPLADKVLVGSVVGALGWTGALPAPLVALVLGRDAALVAGATALRARALGWRWPGAAEFFRIVPPGGEGVGGGEEKNPKDPAAASAAAAAPSAAAPVQPILSSKVNTGVQLALVGAALADAWLGWPGRGAVWALGGAAAATTAWSAGAYARMAARGELLKPPPPPR